MTGVQTCALPICQGFDSIGQLYLHVNLSFSILTLLPFLTFSLVLLLLSSFLIFFYLRVLAFFPLGRSKEIINRGGETISPFEIEEAVQQHPSVKEVLAFSAPHEQVRIVYY